MSYSGEQLCEHLAHLSRIGGWCKYDRHPKPVRAEASDGDVRGKGRAADRDGELHKLRPGAQDIHQVPIDMGMPNLWVYIPVLRIQRQLVRRGNRETTLVR
jgi:hypothetical protein